MLFIGKTYYIYTNQFRKCFHKLYILINKTSIKKKSYRFSSIDIDVILLMLRSKACAFASDGRKADRHYVNNELRLCLNIFIEHT